jgi:valyl-tRNA synthetase
MAKEGLTKNDLGRDKFLERAWEWKKQYGGRIVKQLRKLGASCDWSRERFTMDEGCSKAVAQVFVKLYQEGLIYRGNRIINWCPACKTALSDVEVEYEEQQSHLYYIRYPAADGGEGVIVATTRPETMLGDTGVAVNPEDARYAHLIGKNLRLPLRDREIPVVADEYVEKEFGTGAVKMTPAHDPNDFEVAMRHNLAIDRIMNDDGTMTDACGKYAGMDGLTCRAAVLEDLKALGLLVKIEDYAHNVGTCSRCGHTVEPLVSLQWFVKMKPLAQPAIDAVREGKIRFVPERFDKNYYHWMENTRDWCISRQLWWGHRIPVWYCDCGEVIVAQETPSVCPKCGGTHLKQDEDVLDTWFSSALWPFSTLG